MLLVGETPLLAVSLGRRPLHDRIGCDHLARHEIAADAEVFDRALRLRPPELVFGNLDWAEAIGFCARLGQNVSPGA
jgi:hypothetical protein